MKKLYHYTDSAGLLGIIGSNQDGCLWMSNICFMNDHSEFDVGFSEIENHVISLFNSAGIPEPYARSGIYAMKRNIFVASFSGKKNDLSQWRGYCKRGGYCIGVKLSGLTGLGEKRSFYFRNCNYKEHATTLEKLKSDLADLFNSVRKNSADKTNNGQWRVDFFTSALDMIAIVIPFLKNEDFESEDEYRLVRIRGSEDYENPVLMEKFKFRPQMDYLIPYFLLDSSDFDTKSEIVEVMVGPGPHQDRGMLSLQHLILAEEARAFKSFGIDVSKSRMPLVSW